MKYESTKAIMSIGIFVGILLISWRIHQLKEVAQPKQYPLRDYQIDITDSFTYIWDKGRLVDSIPFDKTNPFDKVFLKDNE